MAFPDIHGAIYTKLVATSGITVLVSARVYDKQAPSSAALPYIVFDLGSGLVPNLTPVADFNYVFRVHSWSKVSNGEAKAIHGAVYDALHHKPVTLSGWAVSWQACEGQQDFVETIEGTQYYHFVWDVRIRGTSNN